MLYDSRDAPLRKGFFSLQPHKYIVIWTHEGGGEIYPHTSWRWQAKHPKSLITQQATPCPPLLSVSAMWGEAEEAKEFILHQLGALRRLLGFGRRP